MANIKLDLSHFKHKESGDGFTILEHKKDKHTIKLHHKALSKDNQDQLVALGKANKPKDKDVPKDIKMAEGGLIDRAGAYLDTLADRVSGADKEVKDPNAKKAPYNPKNAYKYGFVKMAEGGDVPVAMPVDNPVEQAMQFDPNQPVEMPDAPAPEDIYKVKFQEYKQTFPNQPDEVIDRTVLRDMGTERIDQAKIAADKANIAKDQQYEKEFQQELKADVDKAYNDKRIAAGLPPVQPQPQGIAPAQPQQPQGLAPSGLAQPAPQLGSSLDSTESMLAGGYGKQIAGINAAAQAQGDLGKQQAILLDQQIKQQREAKDTYDKQFAELDQERKAHIADIQAGRIDPEKYWTGDKDGNGSHSKIAAGIGMILAGFNPTNNPNAATKFLEFQMEQNLKAQEANLNSKQNLLQANLKQFGNLKDAKEMTRLMQADILVNELQKASATAQSPMAKAAALQAAGKLQMEYAPMQQQFAMRRAMMNLANDPSGPKDGAIQQMISYKRAMGDHAGAKELEEHYVPGIGYSPNQPVPAPVREKLVAHQEVDHQARYLLEFVKKHAALGKGLNPYDPEVIKAAQMAQDLQSGIREGKLGTVYKEAEQPLLDKYISEKPLGLLASMKSIPSLQEIIRSNNSSFNTKKAAYGLPIQKEVEAPVIKTLNGVQYQQVQGGWKKVK